MKVLLLLKAKKNTGRHLGRLPQAGPFAAARPSCLPLQVRSSLGASILSATAAFAGTAILLMDFGVTNWVKLETMRHRRRHTGGCGGHAWVGWGRGRRGHPGRVSTAPVTRLWSPGCGQGLPGGTDHLHHPGVLHCCHRHSLWVPGHTHPGQRGEHPPTLVRGTCTLGRLRRDSLSTSGPSSFPQGHSVEGSRTAGSTPPPRPHSAPEVCEA